MLKGCQKQMIVLHGTGSEIFEEAYFVLKKVPGGSVGKSAMLLEANRIVEENRIGIPRRKSSSDAAKGLFFFIAGLLLGAGLVLFSVLIT